MHRALTSAQAAAQKGHYAAAWRILQPFALLSGNAEAQFRLAMMCANGHGVVEDAAEAARWCALAAEQGHADAQYNLGYMYDVGQGVAQDEPGALQWYLEAARQGHIAARLALGPAYVRHLDADEFFETAPQPHAPSEASELRDLKDPRPATTDVANDPDEILNNTTLKMVISDGNASWDLRRSAAYEEGGKLFSMSAGDFLQDDFEGEFRRVPGVTTKIYLELEALVVAFAGLLHRDARR